MRARFAVVLALLPPVLLGGCGADTTTETEVAATPVAAVADWLGGVAEGDLAAVDPLVDPLDLALIAGAENAFTVDQLVAVTESGLPDATRQAYWASFAEGFADILGAPVDELSITTAEEFTSGGDTYAAVTVGVDDATTEVITRLDDGVWLVDLVATSGPALAVPIRRIVTELAATADEAIAAAYAEAAIRSLRAAHTRSPDRTLELELEAIEAIGIGG